MTGEKGLGTSSAISCYNGAMTGEEAGNDAPICHCEEGRHLTDDEAIQCPTEIAALRSQ